MKNRSPAGLHAAVFSLLMTAVVAIAAPASEGAGTSPQKPAAAAARDAHKMFRDEMAYCASGQSVQGRPVCEKEARAAHAQNLRGALADGTRSNADYSKNAQQRCQTVPAAERSGCMQRVDGKAAPDAVLVVPGSEAPLQATTPPRN